MLESDGSPNGIDYAIESDAPGIGRGAGGSVFVNTHLGYVGNDIRPDPSMFRKITYVGIKLPDSGGKLMSLFAGPHVGSTSLALRPFLGSGREMLNIEQRKVKRLMCAFGWQLCI